LVVVFVGVCFACSRASEKERERPRISSFSNLPVCKHVNVKLLRKSHQSVTTMKLPNSLEDVCVCVCALCVCVCACVCVCKREGGRERERVLP
jgi:hypothetical protein